MIRAKKMPQALRLGANPPFRRVEETKVSGFEGTSHLKKHDCSKFYRKIAAVQHLCESFTIATWKYFKKSNAKEEQSWNAQSVGPAQVARAQAWVLWPKLGVVTS
jgi:hypothetical protein